MGLLAVFVVGWLVRVPPSPAPPGPGPTETPATAAPEPGPDDADSEGRFAVRPVDSATLADLTEAPVATVDGPWAAIPAGGHLLLLERRLAIPELRETVRRLSPPDAPSAWEREAIPPSPPRTWLGASERSMAWALDDGRIRIRRPGAAGAFRTVALPGGAGDVIDGAFVDDDRLALLLPGGGAPVPTPGLRLVTIDIGTTETLVDMVVPGAGFAHGPAGMEWDLEAGALVVMPADRASVVVVDLLDGATERIGFPPGWPAEMARPVIVARDGWIVVRDESPVSAGGIVVIAEGQGVVATNPRFGARQLVLGDGGRMLADVDGVGLVVLGDGLEVVSTVLPGAPPEAVLGTDGTTGYVLTGTGTDTGTDPDGDRVLHAVDLASGGLTGQRVLLPGEEFLTPGAFVVSPSPTHGRFGR